MTAYAALGDAQVALADLMLVADDREGWSADPGRWSTDRLGPGASARMLAGLRLPAVAKAARHMASKAEEDRERDDRLADVLAARASAGPTSARADAAARSRPVPPLAARPSRLPAVGCGFRRPLLAALFGDLDLVEVWEHIAEWYLDAGRVGERQLARYAATEPVALHCVGLSLGSPDCLNDGERIDRVARLARAAGVNHVADHLAFCRVGGRTLPHFFPLWRTEEQLDLIATNVAEVQARLGVRLIIENPAMMVDPGGDITTAAFLNELSRRTGCGVLLDLENLRVNHANGYLDAATELAALDLADVVEVHVAGGAPRRPGDPLTIDTHDHPVDEVVIGWLAALLPDLPDCEHVIVERDDRFEQGAEVVEDLRRLHAVIDPIRPAATESILGR